MKPAVAGQGNKPENLAIASVKSKLKSGPATVSPERGGPRTGTSAPLCDGQSA